MMIRGSDISDHNNPLICRQPVRHVVLARDGGFVPRTYVSRTVEFVIENVSDRAINIDRVSETCNCNKKARIEFPKQLEARTSVKLVAHLELLAVAKAVENRVIEIYLSGIPGPALYLRINTKVVDDVEVFPSPGVFANAHQGEDITKVFYLISVTNSKSLNSAAAGTSSGNVRLKIENLSEIPDIIVMDPIFREKAAAAKITLAIEPSTEKGVFEHWGEIVTDHPQLQSVRFVALINVE